MLKIAEKNTIFHRLFHYQHYPTMKNNINRRSFVKTVAVGGLGLGIGTSAKPFNILPAYPVRDKYKVAVMGVNGRGSQHAQGFAMEANAEVAYLCDVDQRAVEKGIDIVVKAGQENKPKGRRLRARVLVVGRGP